MLKFTKEQAEYVANVRRQHEQQHAAMKNLYGNALIGNASPLPKDVWGEWDKDGIMIQRDVLAVFNDLAASVSRTMPLGKLMHHFQQISDSSGVNISMDGRSKARNDQPEFTYVGTPLPIVDSTFGFGWRQVLAAQTEGVSLDEGARMNSNRKVAEKLEDIVLNGDAQIVVAGSILYGLRNHPKRNTRSTGAVLNGTTGANWVTEITATLKLLHGDNFRSPATIYLNWDDWFYATATEYTAGYPKKISQAVLEIPGIANIIPCSKVPADDIIAVVKSREVVSLLNGMPMMTRAQARLNPEDDYNFVVMAAAALEIKYDANDQCGVAHSS
jgi:hypothetical protein